MPQSVHKAIPSRTLNIKEFLSSLKVNLVYNPHGVENFSWLRDRCFHEPAIA